MKIETKRLLLRQFTHSDAPAASHNSKTPNVAHFMSDMVLDSEDAARKWIDWLNNEKLDLDKPCIVLAVTQKDTGICMGLVGVAPKAELGGEIEVLFSLADEYQGNGYITEAAGGLLSWVFEHNEIDPIVAIVKHDNAASNRVVEKLGFTYAGERSLDYDGKMTDFHYYRLHGMVPGILSNWQITPQTVTSIYRTAWEVDQRYVLKRGKDKEQIEKSILLAALLREQQMPVAAYLKTPAGKAIVTVGESHYCLMHKLEGEHPDAYQSPKELPFQLGGILARLHTALKSIESKTDCRSVDLQEEWRSYILPEIRHGKAELPQELLGYVQGWLEQDYPLLPRQLIHRDPHMGNLLFADGKLAGYIDFDLSINNARLFDLCYFALSFLVGNTQDAEKSRYWRHICAELFRGYEAARPLTDLEHSGVKAMLLYIELLFVAFWAKEHNPEQTSEAVKMTLWIMGNL